LVGAVRRRVARPCVRRPGNRTHFFQVGRRVFRSHSGRERPARLVVCRFTGREPRRGLAGRAAELFGRAVPAEVAAAAQARPPAPSSVAAVQSSARS
jgi:hypothetical protein